MADGKVTDDEVKTQEARVVKLMKEIEPQARPEVARARDAVTVRADGLRHDAVAQHDAKRETRNEVSRLTSRVERISDRPSFDLSSLISGHNLT